MQSCHLPYLWESDLHRVWPACGPGLAGRPEERALHLPAGSESRQRSVASRKVVRPLTLGGTPIAGPRAEVARDLIPLLTGLDKKWIMCPV